jgi:hypothetical protein
MLRRFPTLGLLALAASVGLFALTAAVTGQTPPPAAPPAADANTAESVRKQQEENARQYKLFAEQLRSLERKWANSDDPADRERAKTIADALKRAEVHGVENLFKDVLSGLGQTKSPNDTKFSDLMKKDARLTAALKDVLKALKQEDEATRLKKDIAELKELIRRLNEIKQDQENLRARTEAPRADHERLAKEQNDLARRAQELAEKIGQANDKDNPNKPEPKDQANTGEPNGKPDDKAQPKEQPKPGENAAEQKSDTGEQKSTDKGGDPKDPMGSKQPKSDGAAESKPKGKPDDAGAERQPPKPNEDKAGDGRPMADPKAGDPKSGDPKSGDPKAGNPPKDQKANPAESKSQSEGKAESKPSDAKQQAGDGKPMNGPKNDDMAANKPSPPQNSPNSPNSPSNPNANPQAPKDPAQKAVQDAVPQQKGAEQDLKKNDRENATKKEDGAIAKLEEALKELEKKLEQLREKEKKKQLAGLEERLLKMLAKERDVLDTTTRINDAVVRNKGQMSDADRQKAGTLADDQRSLLPVVDSALRLIEGDGSAIVFYEVLNEVRKDMDWIAGELETARLGDDTQLVEKQVIEQIQRMLEAVKKAQKELEEKKNNKNDQGQPMQPGDQSLIKKVEQLKLIRELQVQVNERTEAFGKSVQNAEQTNNPAVQKKLRMLSDKQKSLQDMLHKMVTERAQ